MDKLGINPMLLLAQIVNFGIVLYLMAKFLYKPVIKVLDERKQKAEETEKMNEEAKSTIEKSEQEKKKMIAEAKKESEIIISKAKAQGQKEKDEILEKAQKDIAASRKKLEAEIEDEKKKMLKDVNAKVSETAIFVAEKVISESIDEKKHRSLIDSAIKDFEKIVLH